MAITYGSPFFIPDLAPRHFSTGESHENPLRIQYLNFINFSFIHIFFSGFLAKMIS